MGDEAVGHRSGGELKELIEAERRGLPFLVYRDGADSQRIVPLGAAAPRVTIGRSAENDIELAWDGRVSRVHVELIYAAGDWFVADDGLSRNGTWVNGERLTRRRRLENGDVVRVGATHVRFSSPMQERYGTTAIDTAEPPEASVSPAQRRVLVALCRPLADGSPEATPATNRAIAEELFLSVEAVKTHLRALFVKFDVTEFEQNRKRSVLAARALASGTVALEDVPDR